MRTRKGGFPASVLVGVPVGVCWRCYLLHGLAGTEVPLAENPSRSRQKHGLVQ